MGKHRIGHAEVTFCVFEVDGVDFVRHGGGADLPSYGCLLEITQRYVCPHISGEIYQDRVYVGKGKTEFSD